MRRSDSSRKSINSSAIFSPRSKAVLECNCVHCVHCNSKAQNKINDLIINDSGNQIHQKQKTNEKNLISQRNNNPEESSRISQRKSHNTQTKFTDEEMKKMIQIIEDNFDYFTEKTKVCCSVEPPKRKLNIPAKTGNSVYKTEFGKKQPQQQKPFKPNQITYKPNYSFDPHSTYKQNFPPQQAMINQTPQKIEKVLPKDNLGKQNGPRFFETQYSGEFKKWNPEAVQKYTPLNSAIFQSGEFDGRTMYKSNYLGTPTNLQKEKPIKNLSSNIFQGPKIPTSSHYKSQYTNKPIEVKKQGLKKYGSSPYLGGVGQYKTEYKTSFVPKEHDHCHYQKKYNKKEIVNMITGL